MIVRKLNIIIITIIILIIIIIIEGVIVPMALFGAEARGMKNTERRNAMFLRWSVRKDWLKWHEWIEFGMKRCAVHLA